MLEPLKPDAWNADAAAHLLARAGFGGTPAEVDRLAALTPAQAVRALVAFDRVPETLAPPAWVGPESDKRLGYRAMRQLPEVERKARMDALRKEQQEQIETLRSWWLDRMLQSPRPLQEKLTLFWHGHFATSIRKVRSAYAMYRQNQTFRRLAAGNWRELVTAAAQEPAMLIYLDNAQSRAAAPNENFARELMELFTLGEGHYTEQDIQEGARALTGWSIERDRFDFVNRPRMHDAGTKTFLGKTGNLDGHDVIDAILAQPEAARFICSKLWTFFAYEQPEDDIVAALARTLRRNDFELRPVLEAMFLSSEFYGPRARRTQVKSPVQWLVGAWTACESPQVPGRVAIRSLRNLGQELFAPPNVKGWDGGIAWINSASLIARNNFAAVIVNGAGRMGGGKGAEGVSGRTLLPEAERGSVAAACAHLQRRLFVGAMRPDDARAIADVAATLPEDPRAWSTRQVRDLAIGMMRMPQYQLT